MPTDNEVHKYEALHRQGILTDDELARAVVALCARPLPSAGAGDADSAAPHAPTPASESPKCVRTSDPARTGRRLPEWLDLFVSRLRPPRSAAPAVGFNRPSFWMTLLVVLTPGALFQSVFGNAAAIAGNSPVIKLTLGAVAAAYLYRVVAAAVVRWNGPGRLATSYLGALVIATTVFGYVHIFLAVPPSGADIRQNLAGEWERWWFDRDGVMWETRYAYTPDGQRKFTVTTSKDGKSHVDTCDGRWKVDDGLLVTSVETCTHPGLTHNAWLRFRVLVLNEDKFEFIDVDQKDARPVVLQRVPAGK